MATVLYSATASVDGFIAGVGGDMSWLSDHIGAGNETADDLLAEVGALLIGKRTWTGDDPNRGTGREGAFGGQYDGPAFVLTHDPPTEPVDGVVFCDDLHGAVAQAKAAAGVKKYVNILGADVARQCLAAGLLDEILVFVAPILLGDGVRLFDHAGGTRVRLTPIPSRQGHWYRVE